MDQQEENPYNLIKAKQSKNNNMNAHCSDDTVEAPEIEKDGEAALMERLLPTTNKQYAFKVSACKMHTSEPSPESADDGYRKNTTIRGDNEHQMIVKCQNPNNSITNEVPILTTTFATIKSPTAANEPGGKIIDDLTPKQFNATASGGGNGGCPSSSSYDDEETDVIGELVGNFGKWQFLMTILLSLFQVPNTFHISSSVYQAANKEFWCQRPEHLRHLAVDKWRNLSKSEDNCYQANIDWDGVSNNSILFEQTQQTLFVQNLSSRITCNAWEYDNNDNVGNNWTSEWNLVCDKEYLKNVAEMFFLLGVATGGIISGYLSDKFGRKKMLFISVVFQTIFGLGLYFVNSFELYLTLRALLGLVSVSVTYAGLILAIEMVDGKWRTIAGMYNLFPLPISYMLISGIAYLTQDYQRLQFCIGLPGIFLCFLWFVVPESPRWLLLKGRIEEVKRIIQAAADFNGRQLPPNFEDKLNPPKQEATPTDFFCLFRSAYLRRISICFLCIWFTMNLVYYGLILNMSSFGGNVYLNSALAGLVEIPAIAIAIYIITKVGKKWLFCSTFICAGVACCCAAITEDHPDLLWLKITFLMIGKFTISAGNTIMPVYTAELYPTSIRNVGVGACNLAAGLALILTPYLSLLTKIESHLLMTLLTAFSFFGGFVILFLPETMSSHVKKNPPAEKC